jgi:hypothetical protein
MGRAAKKEIVAPLSVREEIEIIKKANGGTATPEAVVEYAEDPSTTLHSRFEWDDAVAGHLHRLEQARHILRYKIKWAPPGRTEPIIYRPMIHSRSSGGYISALCVVKSNSKLDELRAEARADMLAFRHSGRYWMLDELEPIRTAIDRFLGE